MLIVKLDKKFKKDTTRDKRSGKYSEDDFTHLKSVMDTLIEDKVLDEKYLEHKLIGDWRGYSECHIKPNWILIFKSSIEIIKFARIGTHQQLFKKY